MCLISVCCSDCTSFQFCVPYFTEKQMHVKSISQDDLSHLLIYYIMKVWNAQVSFDKRDLVHLFGERPVFDVKPNADVIFGGWPTLWNKHLLKERDKMGQQINNLLHIGFRCLHCHVVLQYYVLIAHFRIWAVDYLLIGPGSSRLVEQLHCPGMATTHASNQHCNRWAGV